MKKILGIVAGVVGIISVIVGVALKMNNNAIAINLSRVPRPYFNMGVGECVLTDTLTFPLIPNILFYCVQTVFTNR